MLNFPKYLIIVALLSIPWATPNATTYYVANSGKDTNDGTSETTPWQTIDKVNQVIFADGSTIKFKRGDTFRGAIVTSKYPKHITFGAYGTGDNPILAGSLNITGWKPTTHPGLNAKIYEADVSALPLTDKGIEYLFVKGNLMTIARYPNVDNPAAKKWLKVGASAGTDAFTDPALVTYRKPDGYWKGATLRIRSYSWTYTVLPITGYNAANGKITAKGLGDQLPEWGYFLDGKLEELDNPGEWYYDANAKKVYLYPLSTDNLNSSSVEGATYDSGISVAAQEDNTIIENLMFRHYLVSGVAIVAATNVILRNCQFEHNLTGATAWDSPNVSITGNIFDNHLKDTISLSAQPGFDVQQSIVEKNLITNSGMYPAYGVRWQGTYQGLGISVFGKAYTVRQNTIDTSAHSGMYLKDGGHHLIENNLIRNSLVLLNDGGALTIGSDGNTIHGNFLLESKGNVDDSNGCGSLNTTPCMQHSAYGMGIGADNNYKDNVIENNTVANNTYTGIRLNAYVNTTVRNNVVYNNDNAQISIEDTKGPSHDNVVTGNTIFSLTPDQLGISLTNATNHGSFDNNYYCNPYSDIIFLRDNKRYSLAHWQNKFPTYDKTSTQCGIHLPEYTSSNVGANLLLNATFDKDISKWSGSGAVTTSYDPAQTKLDGGSLKAVYKGTGNGNVIPNTLSLTANQTYRLKFSAVGNGFGNIHLRINDTAKNPSVLLKESYFAYDTSRRDYELIFTSPTTTAAGKILFITTNEDANTYWLDNVRWEPVTAGLNDATQKVALITNSSDVSKFLLEQQYRDLDGQVVVGSPVTLEYVELQKKTNAQLVDFDPFSSKIWYPDKPLPFKPPILFPITVDGSNVIASCGAVANADDYRLYYVSFRRNAPITAPSTIYGPYSMNSMMGQLPSLLYPLSSLSKDYIYFVLVKAYKKSPEEESDFSNSQSFTMPQE